MPFNLLDGCNQGFSLDVTNISPGDETDIFGGFNDEKYFFHLHDVC